MYITSQWLPLTVIQKTILSSTASQVYSPESSSPAFRTTSDRNTPCSSLQYRSVLSINWLSLYQLTEALDLDSSHTRIMSSDSKKCFSVFASVFPRIFTGNSENEQENNLYWKQKMHCREKNSTFVLLNSAEHWSPEMFLPRCYYFSVWKTSMIWSFNLLSLMSVTICNNSNRAARI